MQEYKNCRNCNHQNLKDSIKCENCGAQIGFGNIGENSSEFSQLNQTTTQMINNQSIMLQNNTNDIENVGNKSIKIEKNASQMMWIFIGNWLFYGLVAWIVQELLIKSSNFAPQLRAVANIIVLLASLYLMSTKIFDKNILYKNQKNIFINKIKKFYNIWFMVDFGIYIFRLVIIGMIFMGIDLIEFFEQLFAINFIIDVGNSILSYIILPRIIIIPLLKKYGTESVNEEVKS